MSSFYSEMGRPVSERGSAMIISLFVLMLLSVTGVSLMFLARTEVLMSQSSVRVKEAFYIAEAGQEAGRTALYLINGNKNFTNDLKKAAGDNHTFDLDPAELRFVYDEMGGITGIRGTGDDVPLQGLTRFGRGWHAAFVTIDPEEGITTTEDKNDLVMITSIGTGPNGSEEVVQAIVERWEVVPELPPATVTLLGPPPRFYGGSSDVHTFTGDDCSGINGIPNLSVPVVGTVSEEAELAAETGIKYDERTDEGPEYESADWEREDTFVDLTDPDNPLLLANDYEGLGSMWTDCEAMHEFVEALRSVADVECCNEPVCDFSSVCVLPATRYSNVIFVDGDYEVGPRGGSGTLVVTGQLRYNGKAPWKGMIYAFGAGEFVRKGSGNGTISGAIMVADIAGPDGIYGNEDDCTGGENGFDSAYFNYAGGGNALTQYCTSDILSAWPSPPYRMVNFRQR